MTDRLKYNDLTIEYFGHSAFMLYAGDCRILVDPFMPGDTDEAVHPTHLFLTHGHADHVGDSVEIAEREKIAITASFELAAWLKQKKGADVEPIAVGGRLRYPFGSVHYRYAMHSGFTEDGTPFGQSASILFDIGGTKIYHLGDTALHGDFKTVGEVYKPDVALIPIGGRFTMDVDEAVIAAKWLKPKFVIPMHYGTFPLIEADPEDFKRKVEAEAGCGCVIMKPKTAPS